MFLIPTIQTIKLKKMEIKYDIKKMVYNCYLIVFFTTGRPQNWSSWYDNGTIISETNAISKASLSQGSGSDKPKYVTVCKSQLNMKHLE